MFRFGLRIILLGAVMLAPTLHVLQAPAQAVATQTVVSIQGPSFLINGQLTSPGMPDQAQLLNTRMAQAIFDDENATTVGNWVYPDTHVWDPQRNTNEFVAMLPTYAQQGIRMITVGLQGGCPAHTPPALTCPTGDAPWIVSAFNADGSLKPAWMTRLDQVIRAADRNGIVVMVQFFYYGQQAKVTDQSTAVNNVTDWLVNGGYTNVLVETANECDAGFSAYLDCFNEANVIRQVQDRSGGKLKVSVSFTGGGMPSDDIIAREDLVLLHGNGLTSQQLVDLINALKAKASYQANPKPIVVNEDSTSLDNMNASVAAGVSWGYLDTGMNNYVDGFQSPPVNWSINTGTKVAFFSNAWRLSGTVASAVSTRQYTLANSDGSTWTDLDATNLSLTITPTANSTAILTGTADLWTANAGYNQDLGIDVNGTIAAWKESGGFAGTFSPNAAMVHTVLPMTAGTTYTIKLRWKTNTPASGATIYAGAGPIAGHFSPTGLTVQLVPA